MKSIDILNDNRFSIEVSDFFRKHKQQNNAATELAYIQRYVNGEKELENLFSQDNLRLYTFFLNGKLLPITVFFGDRFLKHNYKNKIVTNINGTLDEIESYYMNNLFTFGTEETNEIQCRAERILFNLPMEFQE